MKQKPCEWCNNYFETNISYQIYCSAECRELATKEKIADRYAISRRRNRLGKTRTCKSCNSRLSAYNDDSICQNCTVNPDEVSKALREIRGIANGKKTLE
jgi:hypothetical protein